MSKRWTGFLVGAAVAVAAAGIAYAAIPGSDGVIHACYKNGGGLARLVDSAGDCNASETATQWNQTGPQGPKGDTGDPGPQGETGPPGVFSGTFESPNGDYSISVTNDGIELRGPGSSILLGESEVIVNGVGNVTIDSDGRIQIKSSGSVEIKGSNIDQN